MITTVIAYMPQHEQWRVTVYRNGALDHRAWFTSEAAADYYAAVARLGD